MNSEIGCGRKLFLFKPLKPFPAPAFHPSTIFHTLFSMNVSNAYDSKDKSQVAVVYFLPGALHTAGSILHPAIAGDLPPAGSNQNDNDHGAGGGWASSTPEHSENGEIF